MSRKTRKLMWSVPLIAAVAVIGALAAFMTLTPNGAAAQTLITPGQVQDFAIEATGPTTIKLTWGAPTEGDRPTGYRIDVSDDGYTWELLSESVPGQDDEYDHDDLMARETKYYRIFAHNQGGGQIGPVALSSPRSIATLASTVPDNPIDLTVDVGTIQQEELDLEWTPPETPPGTTIYQYKVAFNQDPGNLTLSGSRTLTVSDVPTPAVDKVYCGQDGSESCTYTFEDLLEHETWHFQVYAVNEDASGEVGNSNASDSESQITADGDIPSEPTAVWAAVNKNSPGIWLYWTPPDPEPAGAPITDYLIQGRPITTPDTDVDVDTTPGTAWGAKPSNVVVFHNRETADFLLTAAELKLAAETAWEGRRPVGSRGLQNLDDVPNFNTYFSNLEWEFRVFALNSAWKREVQSEPVNYAATLADPQVRVADQPTFADNPTAATAVAVNVNRSDSLRVSLNELNEAASDVLLHPNNGQIVDNIAPNRVDLQNRITRVTAVKDNDTNGGRTKIDISWPPTYSYKIQGLDETLGTADDVPVAAAEYRIQWSTNPDGSEWNLLDQNDDPGDGQQDFTAEQVECDADNKCTVSHEGLTAGTKYTYRVFAMNAAGVDTNVANTVFSWWQIGSATTSQAEVPGRPLNLRPTSPFQTDTPRSTWCGIRDRRP